MRALAWVVVCLGVVAGIGASVYLPTATAQGLASGGLKSSGASGSASAFTASATASQFACSATSASCVIQSGIAAASATTSVAAYLFKPSTALDANDLAIDVQTSAGSSKFTVDIEGDIVGQSIAVTGSYDTRLTSLPWTAIARINAANMTTSVPAFKFLPAVAPDANDLLLALFDDDGSTILYKVDAEGDETVTGTIQPGSYATGSLPTCTGGTGAGKIAYDSTTNKHVGCNGTAWNNLY